MKNLIYLLIIPLLITSCESNKSPVYQKDKGTYFRFEANGTKYDLDVLQFQYFTNPTNTLNDTSIIIVANQSIDKYIENEMVYLKLQLPEVSFAFPSKPGALIQKEDLIYYLKFSDSDIYIKNNYDDYSSFQLNVTEIGKLNEYCSGTFSGNVKNESGSELNIQNGVFRIKIKSSYFNY